MLNKIQTLKSLQPENQRQPGKYKTPLTLDTSEGTAEISGSRRHTHTFWGGWGAGVALTIVCLQPGRDYGLSPAPEEMSFCLKVTKE